MLTLYPVKYSTATIPNGWQSCPGSGSMPAGITGTSGGNNAVARTFSWNGLTTFSDFSGAGDGSPLPVTWLDFNAVYNNETQNVDLSWSTASEINNDFFEVQRSTDAVHFDVIGKVNGSGNSSLVKEYALSDKQPLPGVSYYRIRQVDYNGDDDFTDLRAINIDGSSSAGTIYVYPNPLAGQDLNLVFSGLDKGNWQWRLVDLTGKVIMQKTRVSDLESGVIQLSLDKLPDGIYLFQLETQSQNFTRKLNIVK